MILILMFAVSFATAQRPTEKNDYNVKGNEAMQVLDFSLAQAYYQTGVSSSCDLYSIEKLTLIWQVDSSMRTILNPVMEQCFICLDVNASKRDTSSMNMLILYYREGIGTNQNEAMAAYWEQELEVIRNPYQRPATTQSNARPTREKKYFFGGYAASFEAPFGVNIGSVGRTIGWYVRVRSNLSFQDYAAECDGVGKIIGEMNDVLPNPLNIKKSSTFMGTGGIVIKANPMMYFSVGAGYCSREVVYKFREIGKIDAEPKGEFWAKYNGDSSFKGIALDLDGIFKIGNSFYGSIGGSLLNFKYISANAGIGIFF